MDGKLQPRLLTLSQFSKHNPGFSVSRLRWLRYRSQPVKRTVRGGGEVEVKELPPNGFADAFLVVAGRVYVDERKFFEIIAQQNNRPPSEYHPTEVA